MAHARAGREAHLILKMNALTDTHIIEKLYDASREGVRIDLIVRGACCLRPGVKGISDTIRVVSIVGRYLEHSRVYYARNNGAHDLFLSSADLMGRNLDRRVELMFPIDDPALAQQIKTEVLDATLLSDLHAWMLHPDGTYALLAGDNRNEVRDIQQMIMRSRMQTGRQGRHLPRDGH